MADSETAQTDQAVDDSTRLIDLILTKDTVNFVIVCVDFLNLIHNYRFSIECSQQ